MHLFTQSVVFTVTCHLLFLLFKNDIIAYILYIFDCLCDIAVVICIVFGVTGGDVGVMLRIYLYTALTKK